MRIEGEQLIPAVPDSVWALIQDPEVLRSCTPGVKTLERSGSDRYEATVEIAVAGIKRAAMRENCSCGISSNRDRSRLRCTAAVTWVSWTAACRQPGGGRGHVNPARVRGRCRDRRADRTGRAAGAGRRGKDAHRTVLQMPGSAGCRMTGEPSAPLARQDRRRWCLGAWEPPSRANSARGGDGCCALRHGSASPRSGAGRVRDPVCHGRPRQNSLPRTSMRWSSPRLPAWHAEQALAGLQSGRHVLVEKPIAEQPADAWRLVRTSPPARPSSGGAARLELLAAQRLMPGS